MNIKQSDDTKHGTFEIFDADVKAGEMAYTWAGDSMLIIDHTDVEDQFRGQGIGRRLLDALVAFAREREIKVIPLCPFSKSVFDKDQTIHDVLKV
ncbi:GNAT family N-acetyltransferase [Acinetobacter junii]|uniref:GNAT family N-acetyltransferase n=1 Tax=Acinetobacter junii TaxID=40215 RepID=UPI000F67C95D|nr:GNAT family N-acetyltransferase [Acinetobacter junii]MBJ8441442.1 N-acetyltransferase [Acinetobacter junii]RSE31677.1 N-acetyltransferase [Acinetobacter junii]